MMWYVRRSGMRCCRVCCRASNEHLMDRAWRSGCQRYPCWRQGPGSSQGAGYPLDPDAYRTSADDPEEITPEILRQLDLDCRNFSVPDQEPPSRSQVYDAMRYIERMRSEARPVLVHCFGGIGRTGTMVHAYFLNKGMPLDEVMLQVRALRPTSQWLMLSDTQRAFLEAYAASPEESW
jgi:hypothetical protein